MDGGKTVMERIRIDTLHFYTNVLCIGLQTLGSPFGRAVTEGD